MTKEFHIKEIARKRESINLENATAFAVKGKLLRLY